MFGSMSTMTAGNSCTRVLGESLAVKAGLQSRTKWRQFHNHATLTMEQGSSSTPAKSANLKVPSSGKKLKNESSEEPMRKRSFLLDPPSKPVRKRMSPSRTLPPNASTFERNIANNTYAFLTKLIQAAPESPGERAWIVPEKIIPEKLLKTSSKQDSSRFGVGKWVFSGSRVLGSMVKEGKYKAINSAAYIRQDMAQLVYAQWTIRVAYDAILCGQGSKQSQIVALTNSHPGLENSDNIPDDIAIYETLDNKRIHCVLFFDNSDKAAECTEDSKSPDAETIPPVQPKPIDITQPKLPFLVNRSRVLSQARIRYKDGTSAKVPLA
ncbi:hypothetical protein BGZ49_006606 [Haplosporangium sp. Z 27]|nr:hypothetical protein BGZ49_006606 [Haplosporangium sp. Z 27]